MSPANRIAYTFKVYNREYKGMYNYTEFMQNCLNALKANLPILPNELLVARAKKIWKSEIAKARAGENEMENENDSPLAKKIRLQQQKDHSRTSTSTGRTIRKQLDLFEEAENIPKSRPESNVKAKRATCGKRASRDISVSSNDLQKETLSSQTPPLGNFKKTNNIQSTSSLFVEKNMSWNNENNNYDLDSENSFNPMDTISFAPKMQSTLIHHSPQKKNNQSQASLSPLREGIASKRNENFDSDISASEESSMDPPLRLPPRKKKASSFLESSQESSSSDSSKQQSPENTFLSPIASRSHYSNFEKKSFTNPFFDEPIQNLYDVSIFESEDDIENNLKSTSKCLIAKEFIRLDMPNCKPTNAPNLISVKDLVVPLASTPGRLTTTIEKVNSDQSDTPSTIALNSFNENLKHNLPSVKMLISETPVLLDVGNHKGDIAFLSESDSQYSADQSEE